MASITVARRVGAAAGLGPAVIFAATALAEEPPSEHSGLSVETLGVIDAGSMQTTVGLEGHVLQLRAITIEPGGQIASHSHATRPGLVAVVAGEWAEGRPDGETTASGDGFGTILEDEETVHWFYNRGDTPATALVCDIVAAE